MRLRPSDWWFRVNRTLFLCFGNSFWTFKKPVLANPTAFPKHAQWHIYVSWTTCHECSENGSRSEPGQAPSSLPVVLWIFQLVQFPLPSRSQISECKLLTSAAQDLTSRAATSHTACLPSWHESGTKALSLAYCHSYSWWSQQEHRISMNVLSLALL